MNESSLEELVEELLRGERRVSHSRQRNFRVLVNEREAARAAVLQRFRDTNAGLRLACGIISTMQQYEEKYPEEVYAELVGMVETMKQVELDRAERGGR